MKRIILAVALIILGVTGGRAHADSGVQFAPGSGWPVYASVTVGAACGTVLSANPNNRMYAVICNSGAVMAMCGQSGFPTSALGTPVMSNTCATLPYSGSVDCCAISGTTTINPGEITR